MDIQFWIWLIAVVAMLLTRALRKSAKTPDTSGQQPRTGSDNDHSGGKPMTFEELLREIQESKTPRQPATIQQKPVTTKSYDVDYDEEIEEEEAKGYETIPKGNYNKSYEVYEKAKSDAFLRPSLEETMKLEDTVMKFSHFKGYDDTSKPSLASEVLKDFKDPEGFRKAFIMSEILKRKF